MLSDLPKVSQQISDGTKTRGQSILFVHSILPCSVLPPGIVFILGAQSSVTHSVIIKYL